MRRLALALVLAGSLSATGCESMGEAHKYAVTGAALGAGGGAAMGAGLGDPWGGALIGAMVGGVAGVLYGQFWKDDIDAQFQQ